MTSMNNGYGSVATSEVEIDNDNDKRKDESTRNASNVRSAILLVALLIAIAAAGWFHLQGKTVEKTKVQSEEKIPESEIPFFFEEQLVDHFNIPGLTATNATTWAQRYFVSSNYFAGPGHPIIVIIGGEGVLTKILYPFVSEHLAKQFKAYVLQPEHRFYGHSQPFGHKAQHNHDLAGYLSPEQAMADVITLVQHKQRQLNCSMDRASQDYCPVITIGGSYPGFLSAMLRLVYPQVIDISYASSAPLKLYAQQVNASDYYDFVTKITEEASPGCAAATKLALMDIVQYIDTDPADVKDMAEFLGICSDNIPSYIRTKQVFRQELMMIVSSSYADFNMGYYPPKDENTQLIMACRVFQNNETDMFEKMVAILNVIGGDDEPDDDEISDRSRKEEHCFDMNTFVPAGARATISSSDWSGAGSGNTARSWEYQLCADLIVRTGFSEESMFPPREWTLEWLTAHCHYRFGIVPQPYRLVKLWGFDDLLARGASRILFTNGLLDGWSISSITTDLSESLVAINFPNGAHHSELSHDGPNDKDTDDIKAGYIQIANVLGKWLEEVQNEI